MIQEWKNVLLSRAGEWGLPEDGKWECLLHNNYQPTISTFNVLWFHGRERFPRVVTKVCQDQSMLDDEFRGLQTVFAAAGAYVPKPLSLDSVDKLWTLWMSGVPGQRVPTRKVYPASLLEPLTDTLASVHSALRQRPSCPSAGRYERMVAKPFAALSNWGTSAEILAHCKMLAAECSAGWIEQLPVIPQHGDLFLDNVIRDGNCYYLIDWETFGAVDLPFYDLLTLLISVLNASGGEPQRLNPTVSGQFPILIARYARHLALPVSLVTRLLPLTMANWFYLHWLAGRQPILEKMYATISHYVAYKGAWDEVFARE